MQRHVTIVATSLDGGSRSQLLAREAARQLAARGVSVDLIDLRGMELPAAGQAGAREHATCVCLRTALARSTHLVLAVPVYNFGANSTAKALIELIDGSALAGKTVAFMCAAGGARAYMAVLGLANSMMLDFRCWIVPRFVYALSGDFDEHGIKDPDLSERIGTLLQDMFVHDMGE
jgi:FMN reductase